MAYIDTKYLFQCKTCRHHSDSGCDVWCENGEFYSPSMSKIPTADVVEVKHGEWNWDERFSDYTCSLCHNWDLTTPNYCSNCGAKMDGGKEE